MTTTKIFRTLLARAVAMLLVLTAACETGRARAESVALEKAAILVESQAGPVGKAARMLAEEIEKRTGLSLPIVTGQPESGPVILLGTLDRFPSGAPQPPDSLRLPERAEAYSIWTDSSSPETSRIFLLGRDERGALFAAGKLLRLLEMRSGQIRLAADTAIATAPRFPIRGHQIGYRDTANSYDAWDRVTFEQYLRDLILFGCNGVELITSLDPADSDGPVMTETQWDMSLKWAELVHSYGLEVWFWMPVSGDVSDPRIAANELEKRRRFFEACPHIDHIFVPGGDPGSNPPQALMPWLEQMTQVLQASFPQAGVWLSNQKFSPQENDDLFGYLETENPDWFTGVAFGPGTELPLRETRRRTPERYRLRRYPDITHNVRCQYPVPEWDGLWAQTADREAVNPRPIATAHIHNVWAGLTDGFCSYSDGIHDDLNKVVWSVLGWDPETPVDSIVREYGNLFFGPEAAEEVAQGLFALEKNWEGPATTNRQVPETYRVWDDLARNHPEWATNWRFQMHLFRAAFDLFIQSRAQAEQRYQQEAYACLARVREGQEVDQALSQAREALAQADTTRIRPDLRLRIEELGPALYRSIGLQLSTREPYRAKNPERGALLDKADRALNDRPFLEAQFDLIEQEADPARQIARILRLVDWENPGPGGFYDDLGCGWKQPHLVRQTVWKDDPMAIEGPQEAHYRSMHNEDLSIPPLRYSWLDQAETDYGLPLILRYQDLEPDAEYRVRVTYFGRYGVPMKLVADDTFLIHDLMGPSDPVWPVEFPVPREATRDGKLDFVWNLESGRGCQVAEVWLLRNP